MRKILLLTKRISFYEQKNIKNFKSKSIRQIIKDKIGDFSFIDKDGYSFDSKDENDLALKYIFYDFQELFLAL